MCYLITFEIKCNYTSITSLTFKNQLLAMKKIYLILALSLSLGTSAQTYYPFPDTNSIWHTVGYNMIDWNEYVFNFALDGDTILDGQNYSKVYQLADTLFGDPASTYIGALRENQDHQILLQLPGIPEFVLYDFNLGVGDSIWYPVGGALCGSGYSLEVREHFQVVTGKQTLILANGETRNAWKLSGIMSDTWVEGIGSITWFGLLNPLISDIALCGDQYYFGCFKHLNQVVYIDETVCNPCLSEYILAVEEELVEKDFNVNNSPNLQQLVVTCKKEYMQTLSIEILDLTGREIVRLSASNKQTIAIPTTTLTKGIYLYHIITSQGKEQRGKVFIN
jgi:hypothetical protein